MPNPPFLKEILSQPWRIKAECSRPQNDDVLGAWTDENSPDLPEAKRICFEECEVRYECASFAVQGKENAVGIYGGYFFYNGALTRPVAKALKRDLGLTARTSQRARRGSITNNGEVFEG